MGSPRCAKVNYGGKLSIRARKSEHRKICGWECDELGACVCVCAEKMHDIRSLSVRRCRATGRCSHRAISEDQSWTFFHDSVQCNGRDGHEESQGDKLTEIGVRRGGMWKEMCTRTCVRAIEIERETRENVRVL